MSNKNQHVQDNSVAERRLRPIYDWLDSGNNKKALQECEKVLKKTPNLPCAKALKALTYHRLGRDSESITILDSLILETPTDDATLQAMTLCYREMEDLNRICQLYEMAVKADSSNEELHTHLFMSYVRISDFKSQQKAAMTLYKHKPKNPYYCWAVMSIILQATRGEGSKDVKKKELLLSLAERMLDKMISENKLQAEQEVQLYVMILELQGRYEEILKVIDGPLGEKLTCSNVPQNRLKYLVQLMKWEDVNLVCKGILSEHVDRWDIWKQYVQSVFQLMPNEQTNINNHDNHEPPGDNYVETVDDTPEKAHEFICRLVENGTDNGFLLRGPYLARFELCSKLAQKGMDSTDLLGETIELFIEYFRKFGHKPCCVSDLRIYLNLLDSDKKSELASRLIKDVGISSTSVPQSNQQMQRHICALQLSRLCGSHRNLSPDHLKALVTALSLHYQHGYQSYGTNLLSTDLGPSDPYALLAAHVLYDLSIVKNSSEPIIVAIVLLGSLLKNSPSNFHAKLLMIRLQHTIGNTAGALDMYESLDVKHLQLDSLGFIHCARLPTTGLFFICSTICEITLKFFASNFKDSSEHLTFSYKFGSFLKLDEFMDFRERLNNSLHYTMVAVDRIILNFLDCTSLDGLYNLDISPKDNNIDWDLIRNNSDLSVYNSWDPERIEGPPEESEEIKLLFAQDVSFVRLRAYTIYAMAAAIDLVKSTDGVREKHVETLKGLLNDWEKLHEDVVSKKYRPIKQNLVTFPLPSRLHASLDCHFHQVISTFFNFLISCSKDDLSTGTTDVEDVKNALSNLTTFMQNRVKNTTDDFQDRRKTIEIFVNSVEIVSISSLICILCNELCKPPQSQGKKGKRKGGIESKCRDLFKSVLNQLNEAIQFLTKLTDSWEDFTTKMDINSMLESLNLGSDSNSVVENVINNHNSEIKGIQNVFKSKTKLLSGLITTG